MKTRLILCSILLSSLLVACGGGGASCGALLGAACNNSAGTSAAPGTGTGSVPSAPVVPVVPNAPLMANAGVAQNVTLTLSNGVPVARTITLDGTASSDVDKNPITYKWTLTEKPVGSAAKLIVVAGSESMPTFSADLAGTYKAVLVVNNGKQDSDPASVLVVASLANSAPVANAGPKQNVVTGTTAVPTKVILDGSFSKDDDVNDRLAYKWTLVKIPDLSQATLTGANTPRPSFNADKDGEYIASLVVNDGKVDSAPSYVIITSGAASINSAPVAVAGDNQQVVLLASGTPSPSVVVKLDGTASSDANFDKLSYDWALLSQPGTGTLASALDSVTAPKPSFIAKVAGTYVLRLIVNDGKVNSAESPVTITVWPVNAPPVAKVTASATSITSATATVTLDGTGSTDANKDDITYKWYVTSIPAGGTVVPPINLTVPSKPVVGPFANTGQYVFTLIVNDGKVDGTPVTILISVTL